LWGRLTIAKASCESCRLITHGFETTCLRRMFGNFRVAANAPTRNKAQRPDTLTMPRINPDGVLGGQVEIAAQDYPRLLSLPIFPPPSILSGGGPPESVPVRVWAAVPKGEMGKVPSRGAYNMLTGLLPIQAFARLLAKIAHCFAFVKMREEYQTDFDPLLLPCILRGEGSPFLLIGCPVHAPSKIPGALHRLQCRTRHVGSFEFLYVDVHLFSSYGAPLYRAVAGRRLIG